MEILTEEQQTELSRLNEVFKPFEALAKASDEEGELAVHDMMTEQFEMIHPDRESMNELGDRRIELLGKQRSTQKVYSNK
jgi:hypothetical protein